MVDHGRSGHGIFYAGRPDHDSCDQAGAAELGRAGWVLTNFLPGGRDIGKSPTVLIQPIGKYWCPKRFDSPFARYWW
mgnify:CR=1 FL=1